MRLLHLVVICTLIFAASAVYKIKFDATLQAERAARLRGELRHERDVIAALRAEWAKLETPARLEALAKRYLKLQPMSPRQIDDLARLPERSPQIVQPLPDQIDAGIPAADGVPTGSIPGQR